MHAAPDPDPTRAATAPATDAVLDPAAGDAVDEGGRAKDPAAVGSSRARRWKRAAAVAGGVAVTVVGTAVVTLAATHRSAVEFNRRAYLNGIDDVLDAIKNGFDPFAED